MSSGNAKDLRRATRNIVQEILPDLLRSEVFKGLADSIQKNLRAEILTRLDQIDTDIKASIKNMEQNARDVQTFILNQVQANQIATQVPTQKPSTGEVSNE